MKTEKEIISDLMDYISETEIRLEHAQHALEAFIGISACHPDEDPKEPMVINKPPEKLIEKTESNMKKEKAYCLECGVSFTPKVKNSKYCSEKCSKKVSNWKYNAKKKFKNEQLVQPDPAPPVAIDPSIHPNRYSINDQRKAEQDKILAEMHKKYPVKRDMPELNRDFTFAQP